MEQPRILQQAQRDIIASREWESVIQDLCVLLERPTEKEQLENFGRLSKQGKYELMRNVVSQLQRTNTFRDLQSKVATSLAQSLTYTPSLALLSHTGNSHHITRDSLSHPECCQPSEYVCVNAAKACAYLLQEHCHLKHYIKKCFNHSLPLELRITAWKALLQHESSTVRKMKRNNLSLDSFQKESKEEKKIMAKCDGIMASSLFLPRSSTFVKALKTVMILCSRCKDKHISSTDILLCVPFIYVWQSRLDGQCATDAKSRATNKTKQLLTDIAEIYICFMEKLPYTSYAAVSATS